MTSSADCLSESGQDGEDLGGARATRVLIANTLSFAVCFACWMLYGVLITFLVDNDVFKWNASQMGWLIGTPVLTGSIMRLPVGVLADKCGGRVVYAVLMLISAASMFMVGFCNSFLEFLIAGLFFGLSGASFAVGIAYTSVWFPKERQGLALGIFGAGNAGAAITSLGAPQLLALVTHNSQNIEGWRALPQIYAGILVVMTVIFWFLTYPRKAKGKEGITLRQQLAPLKNVRVWRFGLYYFFVFGGFVALSQWLIPYYLNVYGMSLAFAGLMAAIFSLPSGVIRAVGGWMSDKWGARTVMYLVLISCLFACALLCVPRMDIQSPGPGVMATRKGVVTTIAENYVQVNDKRYAFKPKDPQSVITIAGKNDNLLVWPTLWTWQEPAVQVGDSVQKKQVLARGVTHIFFQANVWIFTALVLVVGVMTGVGKAAVYRHIPDYFPNDVGVVGGVVGVIGGLGGFVGPILFGYLLDWTGIWTTCWIFFTFLAAICLIWMHWTITRMMNDSSPELARNIETAAIP
jgi:NNP family nitrate/nitrite transporter-like MFS transporter